MWQTSQKTRRDRVLVDEDGLEKGRSSIDGSSGKTVFFIRDASRGWSMKRNIRRHSGTRQHEMMVGSLNRGHDGVTLRMTRCVANGGRNWSPRWIAKRTEVLKKARRAGPPRAERGAKTNPPLARGKKQKEEQKVGEAAKGLGQAVSSA